MSKEFYRNKNTGRISKYQGYEKYRGKLTLYFYDIPEDVPIPDSNRQVRFNPNGWTSHRWDEVEEINQSENDEKRGKEK